jgi:hypothetical protein
MAGSNKSGQDMESGRVNRARSHANLGPAKIG